MPAGWGVWGRPACFCLIDVEARCVDTTARLGQQCPRQPGRLGHDRWGGRSDQSRGRFVRLRAAQCPRAGLLVSTDAWSTRSCPRASPCGYVGRLTFWLPSARRARCSLPSTDARQHLRARPCGVSIKSPRSLRQLVAHFGAESGLCRRRAQAGGLGAGSAGGGSESRPSTLSPIRSCGQVTCGACKRSSAAGAVPHGAGDVSAVGTLSEPSAS